MKNSKSIIGTIVCLVIGLFFLVKGLGVIVQDFQTGIDYNTMTDAQVTEGTLVQGEIIYVLDYFEEETLSRAGRSGGLTISRMYFIPVGEKYMAVRVDGTRCSEMDQMVEETWKYLEGTIQQVSTTFPMKGKVKAFDSQDQRYAYDYMKQVLQVSTDAECDEYMLSYYIDCRFYGRAYIPLGIAAVLLFVVFSDFAKAKKSTATYTAYDNNYDTYSENTYDSNSYSDNVYQNSMPEAPKEPVMREDPFDLAKMEETAVTEESTFESQQESMTDTSSGGSFRLKLKDD